MEQDEFLTKAIEIARKEGKIRTSTLQIKLLLGYNRATRLMTAMDDLGLLGGNKGEYYRDRDFIT